MQKSELVFQVISEIMLTGINIKDNLNKLEFRRRIMK